MKDQLEALAKECHGKLEAILTRQIAPISSSKSRFRKLPVWGHHAGAHEINFEWPSVLDFINTNVSLAAVTLKDRDGAAISSI